ncbi:NAD(P)-binding protein [Pontixanthobacter aquaemixtae]|uniref:NAD(P)-binding protein n=1 Tax=Pontixanthobacter aquaemixtae TaxID=1958940 RepID=A0A844ZX81_9SPHN|nr:NAD(P)-binding protein [Pontixanthobacter aquaemixtae]MXO91780.1 NAD(P)-binding protein [Pontixanthobacter aquaemixtae]
MATIETDYLVIGAGAVGLAFVDTLLDEDPDCHITIVDKHAKPGGHWNDAYSFVALHQPSAFYGVNSMEFGDDVIDDHGPNKGLYPLASGTEVLAYFSHLMNRRFLPSGRVSYHPLSEVTQAGDGKATFRSILSGEETGVTVRRKVVDGTFYQTSVPATHKAQFEIAGGTPFAIPGDLPDLWMKADDLPGHYVIVGAGKTAMDTGVWLLQAGVDPSAISWVRSRDSWIINRLYTQPGPDFFEDVVQNQIAMLRAAAEAETGDEMFEILGRDGYMLRIDESVKPEMFHYATISEGEVELLRTITNVIRHGRVQAIAPGTMTFEGAIESVPEDALFIDCTASAVPFSDSRVHGPQFREDRIVLQPLHAPLVTFSAALTAFLEANFDDDEAKNALGIPSPLTDTPNTFPLSFLNNFINRGAWSQNPKIAAWLSKARLDPTGTTMAKMMAAGDTRLAVMGGFSEAIAVGMPGVQRLAEAARAEHIER